jgi:hypothetical protein
LVSELNGYEIEISLKAKTVFYTGEKYVLARNNFPGIFKHAGDS